MANFSLVVNSRFRPFSYAEMLAPVHASTEAHQKLENRIEEASDAATAIGALIDKDKDPIAYERYREFMSQLNAEASELSMRGLKMGDSQTVRDLRKYYNSSIMPIGNLYAKREQEIQRQRLMEEQNPTIIRSRNASSISLDELLQNPDAINELRSYNGSLLTKEVSDQLQGLVKQMHNNPEYRKKFPYLYEVVTQYGYTAKDIQTAINAIMEGKDAASSGAKEELVKIVNNVVDASGIKDWANAEDIQRAYRYASMGLWGGAGQTAIGHVKDEFGMGTALEAMRHRNRLREIGAQAAAARAAQASQAPQYPRGVMPNLGNVIGRGEDNPLRKFTTTHANGRTTMSVSKIAKYFGVSENVVRKQFFYSNGKMKDSRTLFDIILKYKSQPRAVPTGGQWNAGHIVGPGASIVEIPQVRGTKPIIRYNTRDSYLRQDIVNKINEFGDAFAAANISLQQSRNQNGNMFAGYNNALTDYFNGAGSQINAYTTHIWPSLGKEAMQRLIGRAADNLWEANGINVTNHGKTVTAKKGDRTTISSNDLVTQIETLLYAPNVARLTVMDQDGKVRYVYANTSDLMQANYGDYSRAIRNSIIDNTPTSIMSANYYVPYATNQQAGAINVSTGENGNFYSGNRYQGIPGAPYLLNE